MGFSPSEIMILLAAVFGSGTMVAGAGWLITRIRRLEDQTGPVVDHLAEQIDALGAQLEASQEELRELRNRVEFAERLLTAGPDRDQGDGGGK